MATADKKQTKIVCTVRVGSVSVPIYRVKTRNNVSGKVYPNYRIKYRLHGVKKPVQITRAVLEGEKGAKAAAKDAATKIATGQSAQLLLPNEKVALYTEAEKLCGFMGKTIMEVVKEHYDCFTYLRPGMSIKECVRQVADDFGDGIVPKKMSDLVPLFIEQLRAKKKSDVHIDTVEDRLLRAAKHLGAPIHLLREADFEQFIMNLRDPRTGKLCGPVTQRNYISALTNFFNSRIARQHLPKKWDQLDNVDRPEAPDYETDFFDVLELTTLLYAAEGHIALPTAKAKELAKEKGLTMEPPTAKEKKKLAEIVPFLAIGAFGSTRNDPNKGEIRRLDWTKIDFEKNYIRMADKEIRMAKIGKRYIPIRENLREWLLPYAKTEGSIIPDHIRGTRALLCKLTGIKWKKNGLRKACLSYERALTGNSELVSEKAGNSVRMVKKIYTVPMDKEDGEKWSNIRRPKADKIVHLHTPSEPSKKAIAS